jgi:hypothetical protein
LIDPPGGADNFCLLSSIWYGVNSPAGFSSEEHTGKRAGLSAITHVTLVT